MADKVRGAESDIGERYQEDQKKKEKKRKIVCKRREMPTDPLTVKDGAESLLCPEFQFWKKSTAGVHQMRQLYRHSFYDYL